MTMPNGTAVPIGVTADDDGCLSLRSGPNAQELEASAGPARPFYAGVRAMAERRLRLISDTLDLPPKFFEQREPTLRAGEGGSDTADPEVTGFLKHQDGLPIVELVVRVSAISDPDLQQRLLRYLSSIDL